MPKDWSKYILSNIERVYGSRYSDRITGDDNDNELFGDGGNDFLNGGLGNDILEGGFGNDTLNGGDNDDIYRYSLGHGEDMISDSGGIDMIAFESDAITKHNITFKQNLTVNDNLNILSNINNSNSSIDDHLTSQIDKNKELI